MANVQLRMSNCESMRMFLSKFDIGLPIAIGTAFDILQKPPIHDDGWSRLKVIENAASDSPL